jgi:hypothetical protein
MGLIYLYMNEVDQTLLLPQVLNYIILLEYSKRGGGGEAAGMHKSRGSGRPGH